MANKNKEEYRKQVARIKRAMKRLEKHGYVFTESPLPDEEPARVTKQQIEQLERINTERLYYRTVAVDKETGELLATGRRLTKAERTQLLERKGNLNIANEYDTMTATERGVPVTVSENETVAPDTLRSQIIIDTFRNNCRYWAERVANTTPHRELPVRLYNRTMSWLDSYISKYGVDDVASMIESGANAGVVPVYQVFYSEDENTAFSVALTKFLDEFGDDSLEDFEDDLVQGVYDYVGESADEYYMVM